MNLTITYKYKKATVKMHSITEIYVNDEKVGYYLPLYNKPEYRFTPPADRWYVNINNGEYFLIEKKETKKDIIEAIENYIKSEKSTCL
jgi:pyruvate dehydrogenase complex dehydrogenase (E1) component